MTRDDLLALFLSLALLGLAGCPTDDDDDTGSAGDDTAGDDDIAADALDLADANNYGFTGTMDITSYPVAAYADILIDWSALTHDLQGHPVDILTEINTSSIIVFRYLTHEEVEVGLTNNTLMMADVALFVFADVTGTTSVYLSEHTLFGTDVDVETYFHRSYGLSWLHTLSTGDSPGVGTRMAAFLDPLETTRKTRVFLSNDSTVLEVDADLTSLIPVEVDLGGPFSIDWSGLTTDGQGNEIAFGDIDQVMIAHYLTLSPADLEEQLLDLEYVDDGTWILDLTTGGMVADLSEATDEAGQAFEGIDAEGTWILALRCTECPNPAPPFLTVLQATPIE